jgi:anaerobic selenocysteine-containing dehydrogenase
MSSEQVIRTVCPRNCYCTCGMLVRVRDGRIVGIEGDPDNPATAGRVCLKGLSYIERAHHPDRITTPLRRGPDGRFEPAGWDQALTAIADGLARIRAEHGPPGMLYWEGSGGHGALSAMADAFWHPFGGPTRLHGDLCWPAGLEATRLTYGANLHNHPALTVESRFILLWGHNPAETNIHQMRLIQQARERGARLAVVDPRSTDTTDAADLHLQPRPGTDAALALALAHVIARRGLLDRPFLARCATGWEAYLERARAWSPERAAGVTGLEPAAIEELALAYATTHPALLIAGFGLQRHRHAGQTLRAVALLPALTGNLGLAGGGWQYANLASHRLRPTPLPPAPPGPGRSWPVARLGTALLEADDPPVRGAWFEKGNPASQHPRTGRVRRALEGLDLLVVVDQFLTDTARLAHWILPAKTLFEEEDLVTAYWHPYLQLRQKVLEPPPGVRTETWIWRELAERFGFDTHWFDGSPEKRLRAMLPAGEPDLLDRLRTGPVVPGNQPDVVWTDGIFPTPDGRIAFTSPEAQRLWGVDPLPDYLPLPEGHEGGEAGPWPLQLLTCKTRGRIHSQFGNLSSIGEVDRPRRLDLHPDDAAARGLTEGARARVYNARGVVELTVHLDAGIRPGVVHAIEGRGTPDDPFLNLLTDDGITDLNHGAVFYECRVEVSPL